MPLPLLSGSTVLLSACFFLAFLRSPVTIGTTVAWICGVCSSMCSTAETVFSLPNVRCSHCRLFSPILLLSV